jgi:hypothetical protein
MQTINELKFIVLEIRRHPEPSTGKKIQGTWASWVAKYATVFE